MKINEDWFSENINNNKKLLARPKGQTVRKGETITLAIITKSNSRASFADITRTP